MLQPVQQFQFGCGGDQGTTPASVGLAGWKSSKTWVLNKEIAWSDFSALTGAGVTSNSTKHSAIWASNCGEIRTSKGGISAAVFSFFSVPRNNHKRFLSIHLIK